MAALFNYWLDTEVAESVSEFHIKLPDGSEKEVPKGATALDVEAKTQPNRQNCEMTGRLPTSAG